METPTKPTKKLKASKGTAGNRRVSTLGDVKLGVHPRDPCGFPPTLSRLGPSQTFSPTKTKRLVAFRDPHTCDRPLKIADSVPAGERGVLRLLAGADLHDALGGDHEIFAALVLSVKRSIPWRGTCKRGWLGLRKCWLSRVNMGGESQLAKKPYFGMTMH